VTGIPKSSEKSPQSVERLNVHGEKEVMNIQPKQGTAAGEVLKQGGGE